MRTLLVVFVLSLTACANGMEAGDDNAGGSPDAGDGTGDTDSETACQDGADNDGDGLRDCADPDCVTDLACNDGSEDCTNSFDDDEDGLRDCRDPDCDGVGICELGTELSCDDGHDNDLDILTDCDDPDCASAEACAPELTCDDGLDDDADGAIDCLDSDCDGVSGCEFGRETSCGDGIDNDADGMDDCADNDCGSSIACATLCPPNSARVVLSATGMPMSLPDPGEVTSNIAGSGAGVVTQVTVAVNITHSRVGDLTLTLLSPLGSDVILSDSHGGSAANYGGTVFADSATSSISSAAAPFMGVYRPDEPLSELIGEPVAGNWGLHISDSFSIGTGTLDNWEMVACVCTDCEVGAACNDGNDNDGDSLTDCDDPDCSGVAQCIPESVCDDGGDSDLDGLTDCLDPDCDGVGICEVGTEVSCGDGNDNDGDLLVDCADPDCSGVTACIPEADCHDGNDNDGDSLTDCLDPGCFSDPTCQPAGETACSDGIDNDSDGMADCNEPSCAFACASAACPAGQDTYGGSAAGLPRGITDYTTTTAPIPVTGAGTVTRVLVRMSATHTYAGDLDISLIAPDATSVDLSSDNGAGNDNYTSTVFDDAAATAITAGSAPFTGSFRPEVALSTLNGKSIVGDWVLSVADDAGGDTGQLTGFELAICVQP